MDLKETCLRSEAVYDGCLLHARRDEVRLPDGGTSVREYLRHGGAVCILPLTDDGRVVMERQYRYAAGRTVTELPAGKLDSPEEDPLEAAKRELREETGAEAREWVPLGEFLPAVAYSTERLWLFAAKGLCFGRQDMDEDEFLEVFTAPLETLAEQALRGEIQDSKTQALLLRGYLLRQRGEL